MKKSLSVDIHSFKLFLKVDMLCRRGLFSLLRKTSTSRLFSTKGQRVIISEFGNDPIEALENHYRVEEFECPDPGLLGPNDVLIKIKACAVSWVDMLMTSGQYQHQPKPPYTPGQKYSILILCEFIIFFVKCEIAKILIVSIKSIIC